MKFEYDINKSNSNLIKHSIDFEEAERPNYDIKRVNVDFPSWMIASLDKEAKRLGVPRQSIIKIWISERLDHEKALHQA